MYPYFLPCIVTACMSMSAFVFALIGLKEVCFDLVPGNSEAH